MCRNYWAEYRYLKAISPEQTAPGDGVFTLAFSIDITAETTRCLNIRKIGAIFGVDAQGALVVGWVVIVVTIS